MSNKQDNFLDKIPRRKEGLAWSQDDNGIVTLEQVNKGVFNRISQLVFKKPKISYIHLDELGSLSWLLADGKRTITEIGALVKERFGDKAEPLYERQAKYFQILNSYGFIELV